VKIEVDEIMTDLPQTVKVPDGMKLVYVKRWRTIVPLPIAYADEIVEALRPHSSDETASAFARLFPDYKQAGFTGGQAADFEILKRALSLSRPMLLPGEGQS